MIITIVSSGFVEILLGLMITTFGVARVFGVRGVPRVEYRFSTSESSDDGTNSYQDQPLLSTDLKLFLDLIAKLSVAPVAWHFILVAKYGTLTNENFFAYMDYWFAVGLLLAAICGAVSIFFVSKVLSASEVSLASVALVTFAASLSVAGISIFVSGNARLLEPIMLLSAPASIAIGILYSIVTGR